MQTKFIKGPDNSTQAGTERMLCPICHKIHEVERRKGTTAMMIRGVEVQYEETFCRCTRTDGTQHDFVTTEQHSRNLSNARKAYRDSIQA